MYLTVYFYVCMYICMHACMFVVSLFFRFLRLIYVFCVYVRDYCLRISVKCFSVELDIMIRILCRLVSLLVEAKEKSVLIIWKLDWTS